MKQFKDGKGREWAIELNVSTIKRVRELTEVNLLAVLEGGDLLERLGSDPELLCNTLYALVKPEADRQNISDVQFGEGMSGDAIDHGATALLGELVDFFPEPRRRVLAGVLEKLKKLETEAISQSLRRVESDQANRLMEAKFKQSDQALELEIQRIASTPKPLSA